MTCAVEGCDNVAREGGFCWGHAKRRHRGQVINAPLREAGRSPGKVLFDAALRLADCDSEDDVEFRRAEGNHQKAAIAFARKHLLRGGRPKKLKKGARELAALVKSLGVGKAAKQLGVHRVTLYRTLKVAK